MASMPSRSEGEIPFFSACLPNGNCSSRSEKLSTQLKARASSIGAC